MRAAWKRANPGRKDVQVVYRCTAGAPRSGASRSADPRARLLPLGYRAGLCPRTHRRTEPRLRVL